MGSRSVSRSACHMRFPLLALFCVCAVNAAVPTNPHDTGKDGGLTERIHWPEEYQISWQIDIPYIKELQKDGLMYEYQGWQDTKHGRQKTTRDGVESVIEFLDNNTMYNIYPRIDTWGCRTLEIAGGKGPTRRLLGDAKPELTLVLPDLNEGRWQYNFTGPVPDGMHKGKEAYAYSYQVVSDEGYGETTATYTFYIGTANITPLRLFMWGKNLFTDGHFDAYIVDYYNYAPGPAPEDTWSVPDICPKHLSPENQVAERHSHWLTRLRSVLPSTHFGDMAYDAFTHTFGRRHSSRGEYSARMQKFHENKAMIEQHNSKANETTHRLGVNKFADWSHEEFLAVMLPNRGQPRPSIWPEGAEQHIHERTIPQHRLPKNMDWRGSGADSPVKDQAMCGSCWAFGAVGSLEAAYFRETKRQLLLSEQELIDCAWDKKDDNKGCMGGFQTLAYQWLLPRGEIASEAAYPYKGVTDFCRSNFTSGARFKKKAKYVEVKGGEEALMEALVTKGPMTVSVDAAPPSFAFYHSGIYTEPACQTKLDKLDHAVIVSGYGTTKEGKDYWLVKNTWSSMWGDQGYLKISRKPDDCGIATQPIYIDFKVKE